MMDPLHELDARSAEWEHLVDATPGIDPWCSGPDWVLPVHRGFDPPCSPLWIDAGDAGWAVLSTYPPDPSADGDDDGAEIERPSSQSELISGLEPMWGFACPIVGPNPEAVGRAVCERLAQTPSWDRVILPGFPADGELATTVGRQLLPIGQVGLGHGIVRQLARVDDGFDAWWQRRPAKLRRNLRNAQRRAESAGLQIVEPSHDDQLFDRLLAVEHRSWKGRDGSGITSPEMQAFYRAMTTRLMQSGRLRAFIATFDPSDPAADVGFIVGGVRGSRYRGLQLSFSEDAAPYSVSHLLQHHQVQALTMEPRDAGVTTYDLGMDMEYKRRWADADEPTLVIVAERTS